MLQAGSIDSVGALTLSAVTTWENMANFLVAIVLLFVGLQEVQKLNVAGGSVASKAKDFFGKVATIATGYAAGRWLAGATGRGVKLAGKGALWHMPLGGEFWTEHAKMKWARTKDAWYTGAGGKGDLAKEDYMGRGMRKLFGWNVGVLAGGTARRKKHLKAAEHTAEYAEDLLGKMQSSGQWGNRARSRHGELEAYEERSKHRDAEGVAEAKEKAKGGGGYHGDACHNPDLTDEQKPERCRNGGGNGSPGHTLTPEENQEAEELENKLNETINENTGGSPTPTPGNEDEPNSESTEE